MTLDLAASLGYVDNTDYQAMHDGFSSIGLTIPFGRYLTLSPVIAYSYGLSSEADTAFASGPTGESSFFIGGVTFSMAF